MSSNAAILTTNNITEYSSWYQNKVRAGTAVMNIAKVQMKGSMQELAK